MREAEVGRKCGYLGDANDGLISHADGSVGRLVAPYSTSGGLYSGKGRL